MKYSLSRQIAAIFIGVMLLILGSNLLINNVFLEKYYVHRLQSTLVNAYRLIDQHITEEGVDRDYFTTSFGEICSSNNISLVVLDQQNNAILRTIDESNGVMSARLQGYYMGFDTDDARLLKQTDHYTIQKKTDQMMHTDFLEIWGSLTSGDHFIMRIPMESIRSSARISNEFVMYISAAVILISLFVIEWVSRRIVRPIRELTHLSSRMAELDFDAKYTSGGQNEIGQLGEHFNSMSETLEQTISQLKSANNELKIDIEKKSRIDEMRKEFLSNVSHELKTPLALIQGYAEGLKECINDDEESREFYCDVIMDEAGKMNRMVQKLLTLNQLEFGNDQVTIERFDIVPLIRGKLQSIQLLVQQKEAQAVYEGDESIFVWGDEFKIEEVLTNYLSNALNHLDGERFIRIRAQGMGDKVRFLVFNSGQPIPEEALDQVWVKFYKVDKARTREYGGSGVGLSIVKAIMDSLHQSYGVQNVPGGVCFWFELERADKQTGRPDPETR